MARRKGAAFLPLDVHFMDDDRIIEAGEGAAWLYLAMSLKSKALLSDGILSETQIDRLHVKDWRRRLARLHTLELVWPTEDGRWWVTGWYKHNDPSLVVEERREKDAARKRESVRNPFGVGAESGRREEKRREEKSDPNGCPHGADRSSLCALCRKGIEAAS